MSFLIYNLKSTSDFQIKKGSQQGLEIGISKNPGSYLVSNLDRIPDLDPFRSRPISSRDWPCHKLKSRRQLKARWNRERTDQKRLNFAEARGQKRAPSLVPSSHSHFHISLPFGRPLFLNFYLSIPIIKVKNYSYTSIVL